MITTNIIVRNPVMAVLIIIMTIMIIKVTATIITI